MHSYSLPNEIYGEIAHHLHGRRCEDMNALLSLARVNQFWRNESQKKIFDKVGTWTRVMDTHLEASTETHLRFFQSLLSDPTRLGPYVTTYSQQNVVTEQIWKLMKNALPYMVNLKVFNFQPQTGARPHRGLLAGCTFQLHSLTWLYVGDSIKDLGPFLRAQHHVRHLEALAAPVEPNLDWLPLDACPDLMSISCHFDAVPSLARRPAITALDLDMTGTTEYSVTGQIPAVFSRLKYLRVLALAIPDNFPGMVLENLILLELSYWDLEDLPVIASFPSLEVLGLHYGRGRIFRAELDTTGLPSCFEQCPRLQRIIVCDFGEGGIDTTCTLTRAESGGHTEAHEKVSRRDNDIPIAWWSEYGMES